MSHTPGPWRWDHDGIRCPSEPRMLVGPEGEEIIYPEVRNEDTGIGVFLRVGGYSAGDMDLIASAPDLLAALKGLRRTFLPRTRRKFPDIIQGHIDRIQGHIDRADAAIAKAEGRE